MSFLSLAAFGFLAILPIVIFLYFLKLKRQEIFVSSTYLWQKSIDDMRANAPFQKLRRNLLLLLQLLILMLLIFAVARPYLKQGALKGKSAILIIDNSASMCATDERPTRLGKAKKSALEVVNGKHRNDSMMVMSFGAKSTVRSSFTRDKAVLREAIKKIAPTHTKTNIREALLVAVSAAQARPNTHIFIFSDGGFADVPDLPRNAPPIDFVVIGKENPKNIAITALDVRKNVEGGRGHQIFVNVENFSDDRVEPIMEFYFNDKLLDARSMELDPHGKLARVIPSYAVEEGILKVKLDAKDDLPVDNTAWAILREEEDINVLLVSSGNYYLEKVLSLDLAVEIFKASPGDFTGLSDAASSKYDLIIFDNYSPPALTSGTGELKGGYLFINSIPPIEGVTKLGEMKNPALVDWNRSHPATRFANFEDIYVSKALKVQFPKWAEVLIESDATPLAAALSKEKYRAVVIAFDIYDSFWPLRVSFPIFMSNLTRWLARPDAETSSGQIGAGDIIAIREEGDIKSAEVIDPQGNVHKVDIEAGRRNFFANAEQTGVYTVKLKGKDDKLFAVNLLNSLESDITPQKEKSLGERKIVGTKENVAGNQEIWRYFALAAFLVLMLEWYVYNRRVFV